VNQAAEKAKNKPEKKNKEAPTATATDGAKKTKKEKKPKREVDASKKPNVLKYGINHVTALVEQKKAQLVIIAHDVDPIELVVWLPALCRKMQVPYCIVKSKSRLGALVRKKTATAIAVVSVSKEDKPTLQTLTEAINVNYTDKYEEVRRKWGGGKLGIKSRQARAKVAKALAKDQLRAQKAALK